MCVLESRWFYSLRITKAHGECWIKEIFYLKINKKKSCVEWEEKYERGKAKKNDKEINTPCQITFFLVPADWAEMTRK